MQLTHLSSLFFQKFGLGCSFFLTEEDYSGQRFLETGLCQLQELVEMAKAGVYNIETALLIRSEKTSSIGSVDFKSVSPADVIGFVLLERHQKSADCLVFTPVLSDYETKDTFQNIFEQWRDLVSALCPVHSVFISESDLSSDAVEYYSKMMLSFFQESGSIFPSYDSVYSKQRVQKAVETVQKTAELLSQNGATSSFLVPESNVLEICCGNGMSTLALYEEKLSPLCIDINAEDLAIGLYHDVLKSEKTIHMDATQLSQNLDCGKFDTVFGFMIGTIYEFNKSLWFSIVDEAVKMLKKGGILLLTLRSENEGLWISNYLSDSGLSGQLIDNRDSKTDYDQWLYFAQK